MIGRCRTCQASKNTELGEPLSSGPRASTLGTIARCLASRLELKMNGHFLHAPGTAATAAATTAQFCPESYARLPKRYRISGYLCIASVRPPVAARLSSMDTALVQGSRDRCAWWQAVMLN